MFRATLMAMTLVLTLAAGLALGGEGGSGDHDQLPLSFDEMDEYDRIAMEPYKGRYESMPLGEKASAYAVVFEFMRDRPPNYPPEVREAMARFEESRQSQSAYEAKRHLYKSAPPKRESAGPAGQEGTLLRGLSGPWEKAVAEQARREEESERYQGAGLMESLRYGSRSAMKRAREDF